MWCGGRVMIGLGGGRNIGGASEGVANRLHRLSRNAAVAGGVTVILSAAMTSGALAQNCGAITFGTGFNLITTVSSGLSAATAISSSLTASNTAFLTQSTALVGAPADSKP